MSLHNKFTTKFYAANLGLIKNHMYYKTIILDIKVSGCMCSDAFKRRLGFIYKINKSLKIYKEVGITIKSKETSSHLSSLEIASYPLY